MKNNLYVYSILTFLLSMSIVYADSNIVSVGPDTLIYVEPEKITGITPGNTFTVNIKIDGANNLYGFQFKLSWDSKLLDVVNAKSYPENLWADNNKVVDKVGTGYYLVAYTGSGSSTFSGSTTLATVTFKVKGIGNSTLHISQVKLGDLKSKPIIHKLRDGTFSSSGSKPGIFSWLRRIVNLDLFSILRQLFGG